MANQLNFYPLDLDAVRLFEREKLIRYQVALSGNYVQAVRGTNVGEVLDLTKSPVAGLYQPNQFWGYKGPLNAYVTNIGSTGYSMSVIPGADALHWLLTIFSGVAAQLAAGAYPAGLTTDLDIKVEFSGRNLD